MGGTIATTRWQVTRACQLLSMGIFAILAIGLLGATAAAMAGILPWLELNLGLSDGTLLAAGPAVQIGVTLVALLLLAYMPANFRMLALENSHRSFRMRMEDVANAYWAAHEADRSGVFKMKSEFDAVRERMEFLREHPDLGSLEPDILEIAAQMSATSEELARVYSDEKLSRAKRFLAERETEAETLQERIQEAFGQVVELRRWIDRVEIEEDTARAQLDRLTGELEAVLPALGMTLAPAEPVEAEVEIVENGDGVIPLPAPKKRKPKTKAVAAE